MTPPRPAPRTKAVLALVLLALLGAACIGAGQWQLRRAHEREALLAAIEAGRRAPARVLDAQHRDGPDWHPASARGRWLNPFTVLLDNRNLKGLPGLWVATPLELQGSPGTAVLVLRGWVARPLPPAALPDLSAAAGPVEVHGTLLHRVPRLFDLGSLTGRPDAALPAPFPPADGQPPRLQNLPLDTLEPFLDARVLSEERNRVLELIDRRVTERVPAAYLTNEAWLRGHRFYVDARVIVPRSPIAELLDEGLSPWVQDPQAVDSVLDMCTGSGCLAILAALAFPHAQVDAVDVSSDALEVARRNVDDYGLGDRLALHQSNLFDALPERQYDVIVCNPPYVNSGSMDVLPQEYRHEPHLALAGGADGMDLVRRILQAAPRYLSENGVLVLEIGHERDFFEAAFPELSPVWLDTAEASDQLLLLTREQLTT